MSLPSWGAWIEMMDLSGPMTTCLVAPLAEGVGRNIGGEPLLEIDLVTLLAGSVDRNRLTCEPSLRANVALLTEGAG